MSGPASATFPADHERLAVKILEDVRTPIDFRLINASRSRAEQLDEGLTHQLSDFLHCDLEKQTPVDPDPEPLYVTLFGIDYLELN
jgi:hypothetical protein